MNGGDIIFTAGKASEVGVELHDVLAGKDGAIRFRLADGSEVLTLLPTGEVLVKGAPIAHDLDLVEGFREWLAQARADLDQPRIIELE